MIFDNLRHLSTEEYKIIITPPEKKHDKWSLALRIRGIKSPWFDLELDKIDKELFSQFLEMIDEKAKEKGFKLKI